MIEIETIYNLFVNFFHSNNENFSISLCRVGVGSVSFFIFCNFYFNKKYFSANGYFPISYRSGLNFPPSFFDLSPKAPTFLLVIGLISSTLLTLGFLTPITCFLTFLSYSSFMSRNNFCFHSGNSLLRLILFLMIFSKSGQELSLDKHLNIENLIPTFNFFEKLIKIQIAVMYIKTAWLKINNFSWQDGSALHYAINNKNYARELNFNFLKKIFSNKLLLKISSVSIVTVEFSIGLLCLTSDFAIVAFVLGLLLHTLFLMFLRLKDFPHICFACLLIFIPSELIENYLNFLLR